MPSKKILQIDTSASGEKAVSRKLADRLVERLIASGEGSNLAKRDLSQNNIPFIDDAWVVANTTAADQRTPQHQETLRFSDQLVDEIIAADVLVISMPIYNFGMPAVLKAWVDLTARAGLTFNYTPTGPVGLLENKKVYLVVTSGGTPLGASFDYASTHMTHVLGFIGLKDVTLIDCARVKVEGEGKITVAQQQIDELDLS